MEGVVGKRILRCTDGHLFTSSETARLFKSLHLGAKRLMRCPVDGKYRVMENVNSGDLSQEQHDEAARYLF